MSDLLKKYADKINKSESSVETIRVKVSEVFTFARGTKEDGTPWRKVGVRTDKGTFFGFSDAIHGIDSDSYIPETGYNASLSIRERSYTDDQGVEKETLEFISCKVSTVSDDKVGMIAAISGKGIAVNLFS